MTELAVRTDTVSRDWVALMAPAVELAKQVADTEFVPVGLRNKPPAIVAAILYGDEVGLGPMQALAKIAMINGKPTLAAEAQRALILAAGHDIWIVESSVTRVTVAGRRRNSEQTSTVTWTMDDSKRAGLAGKQNWRLYPRQMLLARATAELARLVFADAIGGLLATEELEEDTVDLNGDIELVKAPAATTKRRRERVNTTVGETSAPPPPSRPAPPPPPLPHELPPPPPLPDLTEVLEDQKPEPKKRKLTPKQYKALDSLVGQLRESGDLTTEQLWNAVANMRQLDMDLVVEQLHGRDMDGQLHWSPLRDNLEPDEGSNLIDRLMTYQQHIQAVKQHEERDDL